MEFKQAGLRGKARATQRAPGVRRPPSVPHRDGTERGEWETGALGARTQPCYLTWRLHPLGVPTLQRRQRSEHLWVPQEVPEVPSRPCQRKMDPGCSAEQQSLGVGWEQEAITPASIQGE